MSVHSQVAPATALDPRTGSVAGHPSFIAVVWVVWLREVLVYVRDRTRLVSGLALPVLMLLLFGEGLGSTVGELTPGLDYREFIFPGIVAMTVLMASVFSGVSIIWDREFGFLREMLVSPASRTAIAAGKIAGGATIALMQGGVMLAFAPLLGIGLSLQTLLALIPVIVLMALTLTSLGIALAGRLRSVESFQMITNLTIMPSLFLSGIFFPVNDLPAWMNVIVKLNPVTYAVAPVRSIALGDSGAAGAEVLGVSLFGHALSTPEALLIELVFGVLMLVLAVRALRRAS